MTTLRSAPAWLIRGQVFHERVRPVLHRFIYPVFYVRVNLARLDELNSAWFAVDKWRIASLQQRDYGARDGSSLQAWMRNILDQAQVNADGEIWLQTFPRLFGYVFNPVSFWYCHDKNGGLRAVLAEVNNTFGETHRYLLTAADKQVITAETELHCSKNMHVSPFCQVRGFYRFKFRDQVSDKSNTSLVSLDYSDADGLIIKTAVGGKCEPLSTNNIRRAVLMQPLLTFAIMFGIHRQALSLWIKRVPFFSKPTPPKAPITFPEFNLDMPFNNLTSQLNNEETSS